MKHIVFDTETQKLFSELKDRSQIWELKLSVAVTYCYEDDEYKFWTYTIQNDLLEYLNGNFVIGYNSIGFDSPLLLGENHKLDKNGNSTNGKYSWINYDILHEIKKKLYNVPKEYTIDQVFEVFKKNYSPGKGVYTLDAVSTATLNHHKNGHGEDAVRLFKEKKILDLISYNLQDVRLTKQLYDFIKERKFVINGNYDVILMN